MEELKSKLVEQKRRFSDMLWYVEGAHRKELYLNPLQSELFERYSMKNIIIVVINSCLWK